MDTSAARPVWRSWLILVISGGGALLSFIGGVLFFTGGGVGMTTARIPGLQSLTLFNLAWVMWLVGFLCLPGVVFSLLDLRGRQVKFLLKSKYFLAASLGMLVWVGLAFIFKPVETSQLSYLILPPLILAVTVLPLWWYVETGRRGLTLPSPSQGWGVISFSLVVTLPVILTLELIVLAVVLLIGGFYISAQPGFSQQFAELQRMLTNPNFDARSLIPMFAGLLQQPTIIFGSLVVVSGVIPLIEEMFKPLAVWLLAGDRLTPSQGFVAGMLSGACFALWENLTAMSASGDGNGTAILVARVGTGLLHIVTAGMVSWGLASVWQSGHKTGRLIGAYLLAVSLHGLWNAAGMLTGIGPMLQVPVDPGSVTRALETLAVGVLIALVIVNLTILLVTNAWLQPKTQPVNAGELSPAALSVNEIPQLSSNPSPRENGDDPFSSDELKS